jgi:hypothetical protein
LCNKEERREPRKCQNGFAEPFAGGHTYKPKVLAACPPPAFPILSRAVGNDVDLLYTNSLTAARALLSTHPDLALVVCGIYFDESRMHDLLAYVRRDFAPIPFLAVRFLEYEAPRASLQAAQTAVEALGGVGLVDFSTTSRTMGAIQADKELRNAVLKHLRRAAPG